MIAIPKRSLWLPRWARAPFVAMSHLKRSASTGRLLRNAAGHLIHTCEEVGSDNCGDCNHTAFTATVSGLSNSTSSQCTCLNGVYDGSILFPMAYIGRFLLSAADPCCSAIDGLVGKRYCLFSGTKRCTDGVFDSIDGSASIALFEGSTPGAIDVLSTLQVGAGYYQFRFFLDQIAEASVCDAVDLVRTSGFTPSNNICPTDDYLFCVYATTAKHCIMTSANLHFGP